MKKILGGLSIFIGASTYIYMVYITAMGTGEGFSLSSFALWAILGWITSFTMLKQGANPAVPLIYTTGATCTAVLLLVKGMDGWSQFDSIVAGLTALCIILYLTAGARKALILSVVAATLAGIPFVLLTWQNPAISPVLGNSGFLLTNVLALVAAKAWTVEDRLFAAVNTVLCALLVIPWMIQ